MGSAGVSQRLNTALYNPDSAVIDKNKNSQTFHSKPRTWSRKTTRGRSTCFTFTFQDISSYRDKEANYFQKCLIIWQLDKNIRSLQSLISSRLNLALCRISFKHFVLICTFLLFKYIWKKILCILHAHHNHIPPTELLLVLPFCWNFQEWKFNDPCRGSPDKI